jgi:hypothetical protein
MYLSILSYFLIIIERSRIIEKYVGHGWNSLGSVGNYGNWFHASKTQRFPMPLNTMIMSNLFVHWCQMGSEIRSDKKISDMDESKRSDPMQRGSEIQVIWIIFLFINVKGGSEIRSVKISVFYLNPLHLKTLHFKFICTSFMYFVCVLVETMLSISFMTYIMHLHLWYYKRNEPY